MFAPSWRVEAAIAAAQQLKSCQFPSTQMRVVKIFKPLSVRCELKCIEIAISPETVKKSNLQQLAQIILQVVNSRFI